MHIISHLPCMEFRRLRPSWVDAAAPEVADLCMISLSACAPMLTQFDCHFRAMIRSLFNDGPVQFYRSKKLFDPDDVIGNLIITGSAYFRRLLWISPAGSDRV